MNMRCGHLFQSSLIRNFWREVVVGRGDASRKTATFHKIISSPNTSILPHYVAVAQSSFDQNTASSIGNESGHTEPSLLCSLYSLRLGRRGELSF